MNSKSICKFFAQGRCNKGDACQFPHSMDSVNHMDMATISQMNQVMHQESFDDFRGRGARGDQRTHRGNSRGDARGHRNEFRGDSRGQRNNFRRESQSHRGNFRDDLSSISGQQFTQVEDHQMTRGRYPRRGVEDSGPYQSRFAGNRPFGRAGGRGEPNRQTPNVHNTHQSFQTRPDNNAKPSVSGTVRHFFKNEYIMEINEFRSQAGLPELIVRGILSLGNCLLLTFENSTFVLLYDVTSDSFSPSQQYIHSDINDLLIDVRKSSLVNGTDLVVVSYNNFNEFAIKLNSCVMAVPLSALFNGPPLFKRTVSQESQVNDFLVSDEFFVTSIYDER